MNTRTRHFSLRTSVLAACMAVVCPLHAAQASPAPVPDVQAEAPALVLPDGGRYYGPLKGGLLEGTGRLVWNELRRYEGAFHQGRMEGQGTLTLAYGVYQGLFKDGDLNGAGRYTSKDGEVYEGHFVDGEYDGQGVLSASNGNRYEGRFEKGHFVHGTLIEAGGQTMTGPFKNFQADGLMEVTYPGGVVFKVEMRDGQAKGRGELQLADGKRIRADFDGSSADEGEIDYPNGDRYTGALYAAAAYGKGRMVYANGDVYEGQFAKDQPHGRGTLTFAKSGKPVQTGQWRRGKLVGAGEAGVPEDNSPEQAARNNSRPCMRKMPCWPSRWQRCSPAVVRLRRCMRFSSRVMARRRCSAARPNTSARNLPSVMERKGAACCWPTAAAPSPVCRWPPRPASSVPWGL
ncbi:hypothetical protein [Comamonas odontotermitis]|uniref:hypothetical protein n=1 Tax=Comamonas odontotermitis TaxID=379895 RepID=UPI00375353C1